jgi:hypothetical protein
MKRTVKVRLDRLEARALPAYVPPAITVHFISPEDMSVTRTLVMEPGKPDLWLPGPPRVRYFRHKIASDNGTQRARLTLRPVRFYFDLETGAITISGACAESATGVIAMFTVNSYTVIPMRIRMRRFVGGGMTTTFVSMTHDLTLGHRTEEVKTVLRRFRPTRRSTANKSITY